jgi:hypothetical protein
VSVASATSCLQALFSVIDNAHFKIKTICQFLQLGQVDLGPSSKLPRKTKLHAPQTDSKALWRLFEPGALSRAQVVELVYDISMHIIYTTGDSQGLQGVKDVQGNSSLSYHDLRIASLVAFISARLLTQRFFGAHV